MAAGVCVAENLSGIRIKIIQENKIWVKLKIAK